MTTATPTLDPTAEPLLDEPDRRVCQIHYAGQCHRLADWVMSGTCPSCPRTETLLACDEHKRLLTQTGVACRPFMHDAEITRVEPLR